MANSVCNGVRGYTFEGTASSAGVGTQGVRSTTSGGTWRGGFQVGLGGTSAWRRP